MKEEMLSKASLTTSSKGKKSEGGTPDAPAAKRAKTGAADTSATSVGDDDRDDENTSDIKVETEGGSDVESVTIHDCELFKDLDFIHLLMKIEFHYILEFRIKRYISFLCKVYCAWRLHVFESFSLVQSGP